jgi:hypothetical protein
MRTVTADGWSVAYVSGGCGGAVMLSVTKHYPDLPNKLGGRGRIRRGDADGRVFPSSAAAEAFALSHGYLKPYTPGVYCSHCRTVHRQSYGRPSRTSWCPDLNAFLR